MEKEIKTVLVYEILAFDKRRSCLSQNDMYTAVLNWEGDYTDCLKAAQKLITDTYGEQFKVENFDTQILPSYITMGDIEETLEEVAWLDKTKKICVDSISVRKLCKSINFDNEKLVCFYGPIQHSSWDYE